MPLRLIFGQLKSFLDNQMFCSESISKMICTHTPCELLDS